MKTIIEENLHNGQVILTMVSGREVRQSANRVLCKQKKNLSNS
jgi:hypothetical protein